MIENRNTEICNRIKDIMREHSLNQIGLAEITGVVQSTISSILRGVRNPDPLINAICEKMGVSKEWLVNGAGLKYEHSKDIANDSKNIASCENISMEDKVALMKEMNMLYEKHQSLLEEAQNIMKTIVELNKRILLSNY